MLNFKNPKPIAEQGEPGNTDDQAWLPTDKMLIVILLFFIISLAVLFFSHLAYHFGNYSWSDWTAWIGWGGFIAILLFIFFSLMVKALESVFLQSFHNDSGLNYLLNTETGNQCNEKGRQYLPFCVIAGLLAVSISLTAHGMIQALRSPHVKEVVIRIHNLPPDLEGIRIVQITDLHISSSIRYNRVKKIVEQVNALDPDIIALTGDIVDGPHAEIYDEAAPLADLKSRLGKFFVTGNHEYFHHADDWTREMKHLGFTVLFNEHRLIRLGKTVLLIGGIPDSRGDPRRPDPARAAEKGGEAQIKILLAHRPGSVYEAEPAGFDVQLSGHTHGGQISLLSQLRGVVQPFQSGLYAFNEMKVYVSNGAGYWGIPLRFGAPSEISHIELTGVKTGSEAVRVDSTKLRIPGGW